MIHYIRNKGENEIVSGNLTIMPGQTYMMYDTDKKLVGSYFMSLRNYLFKKEDLNDISYLIDDNLQPIGNLTGMIHSINVEQLTDGMNYRIYSLLNVDRLYLNVNPTIPPHSINYKIDIQKLHRKIIFKKGILVSCEYFQDVEVTQNTYGLDVFKYSNPVLRVDYEYHIDIQGYVNHRFSRRYWAYCDGTYSTEFKEGPKYYTKLQARDEAIVRRTNIVNEVLMSATGLLLLTCGSINNLPDAEGATRNLLGAIDSNIDKFVKGLSEPLMEQITTIDETLYLNGHNVAGNWLSNEVPDTGGVTIRQYILMKLSEGSLTPSEIIEA